MFFGNKRLDFYDRSRCFFFESAGQIFFFLNCSIYKVESIKSGTIKLKQICYKYKKVFVGEYLRSRLIKYKVSSNDKSWEDTFLRE